MGFKGSTFTNVGNEKLKNNSTGIYEPVILETEYISPNQHGGVYGTIYRQYFGPQVHDDSVGAFGSTKLIDGQLHSSPYALGCFAVTKGVSTDYIYMDIGNMKIRFRMNGYTVDSGWADYIK